MERSEFQTNQDQHLLTIYLADRDAHCPQCKYNLRGLAVNKCPECGTRIRLKVGREQVRYGPYLALFALLSAAAISTLYSLPWTIRTLFNFDDVIGISTTIIWLISVGAHMLMAIGFIFAIFMRRKFLALPIRTQWFYVLIPAVVTLAQLVWQYWSYFVSFEYFVF